MLDLLAHSAMRRVAMLEPVSRLHFAVADWLSVHQNSPVGIGGLGLKPSRDVVVAAEMQT